MRAFIKFTTAVAALGSTLLFSSYALGETFTFTTHTRMGDQILVPLPNGQAAGSGWITGTSKVKSSKLGELTNSVNCAGNSNPPGALFHQRILCNVTGEDGDSYSIIAGCVFLNEQGTESNCNGGMFGKAGAYEGRRGSITWHGKFTEEGTGVSIGAGVWNE